MYEIIFYQDSSGKSDVQDYLELLHSRSDKNSKVNLAKIFAYLNMLEIHGTYLGTPYIKHLQGEIWELRPLRNRLLFAYYKDGKFIILHYFIKKTQKTPPREIQIALSRLTDYKERNQC